MSFRERLANARACLRSNLRQYAYLHVVVSVYTLVITVVSLMRHYAFLSSAWDLGIFNQAFYSTVSGGRPFYYTVELYANPAGSIFGVHFSPFLVLLLPFYAVFPKPETLLVLQTIALALGAYPVFFLAKGLLKENSLALMLSTLYLTYPHLVSVNLFDFHPDAFFIPLALSSLYFLHRHHWGKYLLFMILAFSTKEFSSLPFFMLGLVETWTERTKISAWIRRGVLEDKRALMPVLTIGFAVIWYVFATVASSLFEAPAYSGFIEGSPWTVLGGNPLNPSTFASLTTLNFAEALRFDLSFKLLHFFTLVGPLAFLPFFALEFLAPALTWLGPAFLSNYAPYYSLSYHYSALIIPFLITAAVYGFRNFLGSMHVDMKRASGMMKKLLLCSVLFTLSLAAATQPLGVDPSLSMVSEHDTLVYEVIALVPRDASVLTQFDIFPHLSDRTNAFVIPPRFDAFKEAAYYSYVESLFTQQLEFILLDLDPDLRLDVHRQVSAVTLAQIERTGLYELYASVDGALLYRLNYDGEVVLYKPLTMAEEFRLLRLSYVDTILLSQSLPKGSYTATLQVETGEPAEGRLFTFRIEQGDSTIASSDVYGESLADENLSVSLGFSVTSQLKEVQFVITDNAGLTDLFATQLTIEQVSLN